jgi:hypothetical protein
LPFWNETSVGGLAPVSPPGEVLGQLFTFHTSPSGTPSFFFVR